MYIGSSKNITKRWEEHINDLMGGYHHSYKLQNDWNEYKFNSFTFSILEILPNNKNLLKQEQYWIDEYNSYNDDVGYNIMSYTDYKGIKTKTEVIDSLTFVNSISNETKTLLKTNLNIFKNKGDTGINDIGKENYSISKTWYNKNYNLHKTLSNNNNNYLKNILKSHAKESYWTTFISYQKKMSVKGCTTSFISMNVEKLKDKRNNLSFLLNCFINPFFQRALKAQDIIISDDTYSLSILLNWIINVSDIHKTINIYIPSKRMRNLLIEYLNDDIIK